MLRVARRLRGNRVLALGLVALATLVALASIVPVVRPDPNLADIERGLSAQGAPLPPSLRAPLGTDDLGRDVLARIGSAARTSLATSTIATAIALTLGLAIGLIAGLAGGWRGGPTGRPSASWLDVTLMRLVDLVLSFPVLLLAIFAAATLRAGSLDDSAGSLAVVLGLLGWPATARVVRAKALALMRTDFIVAARALGASGRRLVLHHLLPNVSGVAAVMATATLAQMLLAEAALSFVGLGAAPPAPTWGRMVFEGRIYYRSAPWLILAPGLAIVIAVATFHLMGEGLRRGLARAAP